MEGGASMAYFFPGMKKIASRELLEPLWKECDEAEQPEVETTKFISCSLCGEDEEAFIKDDLTTCTKCGDIQQRGLDSTSEFRYFGSEDRNGDPSRIGAPTDDRLPESSLGTIILNSGGGGKIMARIRRYHQWNIQPYKERTLMISFNRLGLIASNHGLSASVIDDSKELYSRLVQHCERRGFSRDSVLACCVYTSLKRANSPRRPNEVANMFNLGNGAFTKAFKFFQEVLAQAQQKGMLPEAFAPSRMASTRGSDYIELPLSKLLCTRADYQKILDLARDISDLAESNNISPENMPPSLAAGCLAYSLEYWKPGDFTLTRIAEVCGVSLATVQKCLKRLDSSEILRQKIAALS
jgi:transcription initiation factor TFIIIB Brf1 subunit/transcription initiation factor TFIIB